MTDGQRQYQLLHLPGCDDWSFVSKTSNYSTPKS